jgi:hypothetical protein
VAIYDYRDAQGRLLYQSLRYEPKGFKQRRPRTDGPAGWIWNLHGVERVLYRLPQVLASGQEQTVVVVEGEKDADRLASQGFVATTNAMGAKAQWLDGYSEALRGRDVALIGDNDEDGRKHVVAVARALQGKARSVRVVELDGLPPRGDVSDWLDAGHTAEELRERIDTAPIWAENTLGGVEEWGDPLPLTPEGLPAFPVHVLPPALRCFCEGLGRALQVPVDLVALLVLACCAAAVARKVVVQIRDAWWEPLNIWVVVALTSGNRKSATVRAVVAPIKEWLREHNEKRAPEIAQETSRLKIKQEQLKRAEQDAAKDPGNKELEEAAVNLAAEVASIAVPQPTRLLAIDVTPEKLVGLFVDHDGRMAIIVPEGGVFDMMAGKYSNGVPNLDAYLAAYCGDDIIVDRQGRPSQVVEDPALTMGISPQPDVLCGLGGKPGFRGRGLLARFQYGLPPSPVGRRACRPQPLTAEEKEPYTATVQALLDLDAPSDATGRPTPTVLHLSEGAQAAFEDFVEKLEPELGDEGRLGAIADWGSKLAGALARYAALFHLAEHAGQPNTLRRAVSAHTMREALSLAGYFEAHAKAAFGEMGASETLAQARAILSWIRRAGKTSFSKRQCWQGVHGRAVFAMADDLDRPLQLLCDHNIIRPVGEEGESEDGKRRGRKPGARFDVNPRITDQKGQNRPSEGDADNSGLFGPSSGSEQNGEVGKGNSGPFGPSSGQAQIDDADVEELRV